MASSADKKVTEQKRKADESPESEKIQPRLRRRGSLPDLHEVHEISEPKKTFTVPELMRKGLRDPDVMRDLVPAIMTSLQPMIEAKIEQTIQSSIDKSFAASIDKAVNDAISKYRQEVMKPLLDQRDEEIKLLKSELNEKTAKLNFTEAKVQKLEKGLDDLNQYGRRQSIRLNNVQIADEVDCEKAVLDILNKALPDDQNISASDIDRCHTIGKANKKGNRQVIVKFQSYKIKAKIYDARFNLRNIYMTEDLSPKNQALFGDLVKLRRAKKVTKLWTIDGKIYAKAHNLQPKVRITCGSDIDKMFEIAVNEGYINQRGEDIQTDDAEVSDMIF